MLSTLINYAPSKNHPLSKGNEGQCIFYHQPFIYCTVQTFNSCTSRPDVCQCQPVQKTINNMSENKPGTPVTNVAYESKLRSVVRSSMHPWQTGVRSCITPGLPRLFSAGIKCRHCTTSITLPMLRLLSSKKQGRTIFL